MKSALPRGITLAALAASLLTVVTPASVALAHAKLVRAEPAADTIVTTAPAQLKLRFSEELDVRSSTAQAFDAGGKRLDTGTQVDLNDRTLLVVTTPSVPAGLITVKWHSVAADDQGVVDGSYTITVAASSASAPTAAQTLASQEGTFVRASGPRVYWISGGKRRHVPTIPAFLALGGVWNAVQTVDDATLLAVPEQADVAQGSGADLFLVVGTVKVWLPSIDALKGLGYQTLIYRQMKDADLAALPTKNDLVKGSAPDVFVLFGGNRYLQPNIATFASRGFQWGDVRAVTDAQLALTPVVAMSAGM